MINREYKIEINGASYSVKKIALAYSADKTQLFWYASEQDRDKDLDGSHPELVLSYTKLTPEAERMIEQMGMVCDRIGTIVHGERPSIERKLAEPQLEIAPGVAAVGNSTLAYCAIPCNDDM